MPFDVSAFIAVIGEKSVAPTSAFEVMISGPVVSDTYGGDLTMRCDSVVFPGRSLTTTAFSSYGVARDIVTSQQLSKITCTFICSEDFSEKNFFQRWQDMACGNSRRQSGYGEGMFDLGYYDTYIGTVDIIQYSPTGEETYTCKLLEAYPVEIGALPASWDNDGIHRLQVTFQYYIFRDDPEPQSSDPAQDADDLFFEHEADI